MVSLGYSGCGGRLQDGAFAGAFGAKLLES